jgi:hypothetical protein
MVSKASFARVAASILLAMACVGPAWADALVVPEVPSEVIAPTPITLTFPQLWRQILV